MAKKNVLYLIVITLLCASLSGCFLFPHDLESDEAKEAYENITDPPKENETDKVEIDSTVSNNETDRETGIRLHECDNCLARGKLTCNQCDGFGMILVERTSPILSIYYNSLSYQEYVTCINCNGTGKTDCPKCCGDGFYE
ncbi:MAG: hypothetical protein IJ389_02015 [Clostridia bacterium]|nr:hypothetical protein [Clostridia bacterium]